MESRNHMEKQHEIINQISIPKTSTFIILGLLISLQLEKCDYSLESICNTKTDMNHGINTRDGNWTKERIITFLKEGKS